MSFDPYFCSARQWFVRGIHNARRSIDHYVVTFDVVVRCFDCERRKIVAGLEVAANVVLVHMYPFDIAVDYLHVGLRDVGCI